MFYWLLNGSVKLLAVLPFKVLFLLSDLTYLLVYKLFRYRLKVVRENIKYSFPEKSKSELRQIERDFYHHFCDLIFESFKLAGIKESKIRKRMLFLDYEPMIAHFEENRSVMLLTSHYGNWEWSSTLSLYLPKDKPLYLIYKKQRGEAFGKIINGIRTRFGGESIEMKSLAREMVRLRNENKLGMYGMLSDQSPGRSGMKFFTNFLNQHTAVIVGTEQLAKKFDYPVYYVRLEKIKRGYYTCRFVPITTSPKETDKFEISEKYMRLLEEDIVKNPAHWLWTHKRWKHTRK